MPPRPLSRMREDAVAGMDGRKAGQTASLMSSWPWRCRGATAGRFVVDPDLVVIVVMVVVVVVVVAESEMER